MKNRIILCLTMAAVALGLNAAKLVNNKKYVMIPLAAGREATLNHFMTGGSDGAVSLEANFSEAAVWQWSYVSGTATVAGHYTLKNVSTGKYLFAESDGVVTLTDADVSVTKGDSPVTDAAVTLTADGKCLAVTDAGAVTVSDDAAAVTSAFVMMDYVASQSAEEIEQAAADAVAVAFGIPDAVNQLLPMLQASYTGTKQAQRVLNVLYYSQTPADISTQLVEVRRTAVRMFESDFENGVVWRQKGTGLYVSATDDGFAGKESATGEGVWFGHFTDSGNSVVEGRKFRLYSNATKQYLKLADNGGIATTTAQNDATLWTVTYFYGEGLGIKPAADENNDRLLYLGADKSLTTGSDKSLALTYAGEINMYGEGVNSVRPTGPETTENGESVLTGVNAIELVLKHGSVAAADGALTLTYTSDEETTTLEVIPATVIKNPVTKTIDVDFYNSNGTHVTGTEEVDVYTIALEKTYADGGQYMVRVNMGAFLLDDAMSREMAGYCDLAVTNLWEPVVTPAAGTVTELKQITITGVDGIYPNPKAPATASVDINRDGETLQMFYSASFAEGGEFDTYDMADPSKPWFTIPVDYTGSGRYSVSIEQSFFVDNSGNPCASFSVVWEIDAAGIHNVHIERDATVRCHDLLGRPVKADAKGVVISDGKKTLNR